jgi:hypothetical protein
LVTVATDGFKLVHVPPDVGLKVVVPPMHKVLGPVITAVGLGETDMTVLGLETQPVVELVNVKKADPNEAP